MKPLVLAAHTNNYEIIKILLDRGAGLPCPHHHRKVAPLPTSRLFREKFQCSKDKIFLNLHSLVRGPRLHRVSLFLRSADKAEDKA